MFTIELIYVTGFTLGSLSLIVFLLGHLGLLTPNFVAAAVIASLFLFSYLKKNLSEDRTGKTRFTSTEKFLLVSIGILLLSVLPLALTPPSVRDELIQHLAIPKLYLAKAKIFEIPMMGFSYLPQNIDLLYLVPMAFGDDIAPRLIHFGFAILTGSLIYFYLSGKLNRQYGLLGMLIYLSTPLAVNLSRVAYADHGAAFYSTLSLIAILKWKDSGFPAKWLIFSAVSMGFALGAKFNNLLSFALLNAFVSYIYLKKMGKPVKALKFGVIYFVITAAVLSPWLIRNYIWTGSPLYPIWESAGHAAVRGEGLHITSEMSPIGKRYLLYNESTLDLILLPVRIFFQGADNSIERFDGVLNPFLLAFLPFLLVRKNFKDIGWLGLYCALFFVMAFLTVDMATRYLLPILPAFVILVVAGINNLADTKKLKLFFLALISALFVFSINYISGLHAKESPFLYIGGEASRDEYLSVKLPDYNAVNFSNQNLPENAKVLLLFAGDRGYYWERDYVYWDRTGVFFKDLVKRTGDEEALKKGFRSMGISHIVMNDSIVERFANNNFKEQELKVIVNFFNTNTSKLYTSNGFSVYALK
ncbi:MAG: phospholipid carrier-dependent glycosyltransferase [Deltaproteobacteria bacterium]|nr:phospholipid carrier-dependent glycosyltransferase [Deltaproteobacteria bacterium]